MRRLLQCLCLGLLNLKADLEKLNVNGGAMALGHPLGATGAKLMTTLFCMNSKEEMLNLGFKQSVKVVEQQMLR